MSTGEMIYFDNAATTFPKPESVYQAMDEANRRLAVNAGRGSYALAKEADQLIKAAREAVSDLVCGSQVAEVVFTASATLALNQIIGGMTWSEQDVVYVSPYEHNAVMRPLHLFRKKYGFQIQELPLCEADHAIDLEKTSYLFAKQPPNAVFLTHISNVTGYILPVEELTGLAKAYDASVVVDASQSMGLFEIDLSHTPVDFLVFAGHKNLYGPLGTGGFLMRKGCRLEPYIAGGTGSDSLNLDMPKTGSIRYEAASPNVVAIAGLYAACMEIKDKDTRAGFREYERMLTRMLVEGLHTISGVKLYLPPKEAHIGIAAFNIDGYQAGEAGMVLDEDYGIAVRTGYHCAPLIHEYLDDKEQLGVIRAGIGRYTTKEEVEKLIRAVSELAE